MTCTELTEQDDAPHHQWHELGTCRTSLVFGGVNTFERGPEGKEDRMMEVLFMKKDLKVYANADLMVISDIKPIIYIFFTIAK